MTIKTFATFNDGTKYSVKTALNTYRKGAHRLLVAVFNETIKAIETRQPDTIRNLFDGLAGDVPAQSTMRALVSVLSAETVTIKSGDKDTKINFNPEAKGGSTTQDVYCAIVVNHILAGHGIYNAEMLEALGLKSSETKPVDYKAKLAKDVAELIKSGMEADGIRKLVNDAIAKQVAASAPSKPVMDKPSHDNTANVQRLKNAA